MVIGIVIADTILVLAAVPSLRVFIETLGPLKEVLHPVAGIGLIVLGIGAGRAPSCAAEEYPRPQRFRHDRAS